MDKETAIMVIQSIPQKIWNQLGPAEHEAIGMMYSEFVQNQWQAYPEKQPDEIERTYLVQCDDNTGYVGECRWTNNGYYRPEYKTDWHWTGVPQYSKVIAFRPMIERYVKEEE